MTEYSKFHSAGGKQEGKTLNLKQQFTLAMSRLDTWDVQIQVLYAKTTPEYKAIFKDGRKPFNSGSIDTRISAFETLSENLDAYADLAAVKALVDTTFATLLNARKAQEGAKGNVKGSSGNVETARLAAMNMQYRNMGFVMDNFFDTRITMANQLFDLETLRDHQQSVFTGTLDPLENEAVLIHTFLPGDELRLKSNGPANIKFYLASTPRGTNSTAVEVLPNEERVIIVDDFAPADYATHRYLTAVNQQDAQSTQYIVEVL